MGWLFRICVAVGVAVAGAGLAAPPAAESAPSDSTARAIRLAVADTADSPLGHGTALVVGASGLPVPPAGYVDAANTYYLAPRGFDGTLQPVVTPESLWPLTGIKNLTTDESFAQGGRILADAITQQIAGGHVDAANPVVVFAYSQGATVETQAMSLLAAQGVPSDLVHFVMLGNPSNPDGGILERFNVPIDGASPTIPSFGLTFSGATPSDLYPTDIYTIQYDGFADFPRYPINILADFNALLGMGFSHGGYLGLTSEQIQGAIELQTAEGGLTNYYMIPADSLPLLAPLQFLPVIGQPLYDLLQPATSILVNLGYGCISDSWCEIADASSPTTFGLFPADLNWADVATALGHGVQQGISNAINDLQDPATYQLGSILDTPALQPLLETVYRVVGGTVGDPDPSWSQILHVGLDLLQNAVPGALSNVTWDSSPTEIFNAFIANVSNDYATLLPIADTFNALLTTLPSVAVSFLTEQAADGNLLGGIGEALAAATALIPLGIGFGIVAPVAEAIFFNGLNLVNMFPGAIDALAELVPLIP
ncbi:PE-PPE domain-containing protein [[Mycobacterium] crassicus]|uniref:PE-PPE domain-containing protein n=1 Tax=[Mycobacterium] crassicus TaxID=2872309 RepID=A0ABU5XHJ9_9MYCO|nr:PE-PPE domain-containing protein [Mycolicibacter sp. MYC098]MEB3021676.1 PE-PPE domain-containing protein [Mycolicibacter sp. MYC098]